MSGLEERILTLIKDLEEEKRLADKRAKQLYLAAGGGSFISHDDTPSTYAAQAGKFVKVNAIPDALLFANLVAGDLPSHSHVWADVSKTGSNLTDLATRQHAGLTNVTSDQHHPQSHTLASHSSKLHSELTSVTVNQHHARDHEATHRSGGADPLNHDNLPGFLAAEHKSLPNTIAQVLSNHTKAVHDALLITVLGSGALAKDHGAAGTDMLVNVCYGTGDPPAANTTTIGTIYIKYTA